MANQPNFGALLDMAPAEVERPKPWPVGVYTCVVQGLPKQDKSSKKQTEYVEFTLKPTAVVGEVDEDALKEMGGLNSDKTIKVTHYLTENSLWRLKDFLEHCGIDLDDHKTLRAAIEATPNCQVNVAIGHDMGNDGKTPFAVVKGTSAVE